MNKKLGIILMFVGAYVVVLGGLFWNMSAPSEAVEPYVKYNVFDWFWGLSAGVVIAIGAALAAKKKLVPGLIGNGIAVLGIVYSFIVVFIGNAKENYFSVWIFVGAIIALIGVGFSTFFHIEDVYREKKYGKTLL